MKVCIKCFKPLKGKQRKYCDQCGIAHHKELMRKYYYLNKEKWQYKIGSYRIGYKKYCDK